MAATSGRRERERVRHRREILEAAARLFAARGFERVTMAEIAEAAEFAVGTLYRFFASKDELFEALIGEVVEEMAGEVERAVEGPGNAVERIERAIEATTALFFRRPEMVRLLLGQGLSRGPGGGGEPGGGTVGGGGPAGTTAGGGGPGGGARRRMEEMRERLVSVFRSGTEKGLFVDIDAGVLAAGFAGVSEALFAEALRRPGEFTEEKLAGLRKRLFFDAVRVKPRMRLQ